MSNLREIATALLAASSALAMPQAAVAQARFGRVVVNVTANGAPLAGATVVTGTANTITDRSGQAAFTLSLGRRTFHVRSAGFLPDSLSVTVSTGTTPVNVALRRQPAPQPEVAPQRQVAPREVTLPEPVIVTERDPNRGKPSSARVEKPRSDPERDPALAQRTPAGVEVTDHNAIEEQLDRSPGDIANIVTQIDGVRAQRLSAGSAGTGVRIRGLPGRYSKILLDGLPVFGATPEGLDLIQTPALGVERVEILKGVSSALYGPTALSGVVNVVASSPRSESEALVNGSSLLGTDVGIFQTHTFSPKWSASLVAGRHYQSATDPDGDGWSEASGYKRFVIRPRVYWARSDRSTWFMTGGWTSETRRSGTYRDQRLPDFNTYREDNGTRRADAGAVGRINLDSTTFLTIRASMTRDWRTRWYGQERERNRRNTIFGDVGLTKSFGDNVLVGGVAFERDQYAALDVRGFSYRYTTPALYAEHTWTPQPWFNLTSGARLDLHSEYGDFVSPRVSALFRPSETFTARLTHASGVYAPTPLTDETEAFGLSQFRSRARDVEHATGWSIDLDRIEGALELRGSAYRTVIAHPLTLRTREEELELVTADEPAHSQGVDVSARYRARPLRYTLTYSFIEATRPVIGVIEGPDFSFDTTMHRAAPLNPQHAVGFDVAHERENKHVVGVSIRVVGRQPLSDTLYTLSRTYVTMDARLEQHVRGAILFVSGRNLTAVKQDQLIPVLLPSSSAAGTWTRDAWGPLDGLVVSAGLRMKYRRF